MRYTDFTLTIVERQGAGYPVTASTPDGGRVSDWLVPAKAGLANLLRGVEALEPLASDEALLRRAGEALFRWLMQGPLETHLRLAWDRAQRSGRGLRIRLSIDPPELAAWPWELLHDPLRDHTFATSVATPVMRFLDQADRFGGLARQSTRLPLKVLLVLPTAPDLDLAHERALVEESLTPLGEAVHLTVLEGTVTRTVLADALLEGEHAVLHFAGHGDFADGKGYLALNRPDGSPDWVDGDTFGRLCANYRSLKLVVANACSTGRVDDTLAFRGLAPQMVRHGIPAVVAMQYPPTDQAAMAFAREFYRQLATGENAGLVDVAVTYARAMLAVLWPGTRSFAAPLLYTHAPDGVLFSLPREVAAPGTVDSRVSSLGQSLEASRAFDEDWALADRGQLEEWRAVLQGAADAYRAHLADPREEPRRVAQQGLELIQSRLAALEAALARLEA